MRWIAPVAAVTIACSSPAAAGSKEDWDKASSVGRSALVVAALGIPAVQGDWKGDKQAAVAIGGTWVVTEALKRATNEQRPDRSDDKSFPSGHTSSSFAAAATLEKRYGWKVGLPAHLVAALVGVARVKAKKHYVHDVVAGALLGEATGWLVTSKKDQKVQWLPYASRHGVGASLAMRF
ncbi:MAG TPA: phosphatase PAP2 family protein [Sphingomicrobium sp.]|jgi:membrane-associated phospholipid phosphatase